MGSLVIESCNYSSQVKSKAENRITFHHQYDSKASKGTDEGSSSTVTSNSETQMSKSSEEEMFVIEQLNKRLTCLEEEAQMMQDFYQTIQERKQLMDEIYQQFQFIRCRDQLTPDQFSKVRTKRRGGPGLSQVLCQDDFNLTSVIVRNLKARAVKSSRIEI